MAELEKHLGSARKEVGALPAGSNQGLRSCSCWREVGAPWCSASCAGTGLGSVLASGEPPPPSLFFPGWGGFVWAVLCRAVKGCHHALVLRVAEIPHLKLCGEPAHT